MTEQQSIIDLLTETRGVLSELHRLGLPGLDPRLPPEILEHNLYTDPKDHILLLEETMVLAPYFDVEVNESIDPYEQAMILMEANGDGRLLMRGVFQRAGKKNQNGRIYSNELLQREVKRLQDSIDDNRLGGELDHPQSAKIRVPVTSHLITKLWIPNNSDEVYGELTPTHNSSGRDLFNLITKDKMRLGVSSRGTGTLKETDNGLLVQPNYNMITFDIVADPSTHGAFPTEVNNSNKKIDKKSTTEEKQDNNDSSVELLEITTELITRMKNVFGQRPGDKK